MKTIVKAVTIPALGGFTLGLGFLAGAAVADTPPASVLEETCVTDDYTPGDPGGSLIDLDADANVGGDPGIIDVNVDGNVGSNPGDSNNGNNGNSGNGGNNGNTPGTPTTPGSGNSNTQSSLISVDANVGVGDKNVGTGNNGSGTLIDLDANVNANNDNGGFLKNLLNDLL